MFIIGAKIDLAEAEQVSIKEVGDYAAKLNAHVQMTSSKDGTGVQELFQEVADKVYAMSLGLNKTKINNRKSFKITEEKSAANDEAKDGCSC